MNLLGYLEILEELPFDDLIMKAALLLKNKKNVRTKYQEKFLYVFVDELQDTNLAQYELIKLISKTNTFAVGDQDQSIYG
jgi:superfamily I DNA/RNA helicase